MFVRNAWYVAAWDHEIGRSMSRPISWSQAATYQALRTNMGDLHAFDPQLIDYQRDAERASGDIEPQHESGELVRQHQQDAGGDERHAHRNAQYSCKKSRHRGADQPDAGERGQRDHRDVR